jgi:hypothetical protein
VMNGELNRFFTLMPSEQEVIRENEIRIRYMHSTLKFERFWGKYLFIVFASSNEMFLSKYL